MPDLQASSPTAVCAQNTVLPYGSLPKHTKSFNVWWNIIAGAGTPVVAQIHAAEACVITFPSK